MQKPNESENIFLEYFIDREMYRRPDYPEIYKNMKVTKINMEKAFKEYFYFREFKGYRK